MSVKMKRHWFEGERVVHLEPEKKRRVTDTYLKRPYLYTGRALTDTTLIHNTKHHIRHMKLFGRQMSGGVIRGLELSFYAKQAMNDSDVEITEYWLPAPGSSVSAKTTGRLTSCVSRIGDANEAK